MGCGCLLAQPAGTLAGGGRGHLRAPGSSDLTGSLTVLRLCGLLTVCLAGARCLGLLPGAAGRWPSPPGLGLQPWPRSRRLSPPLTSPGRSLPARSCWDAPTSSCQITASPWRPVAGPGTPTAVEADLSAGRRRGLSKSLARGICAAFSPPCAVGGGREKAGRPLRRRERPGGPAAGRRAGVGWCGDSAQSVRAHALLTEPSLPVDSAASQEWPAWRLGVGALPASPCPWGRVVVSRAVTSQGGADRTWGAEKTSPGGSSPGGS